MNKSKAAFSIIHSSLMGIRHQENEDSLLFISSDEYLILCVLDGVGSSRDNKIGTELAKNYIRENHYKYYIQGKNYYELSSLVYDINEHLLHQESKELHSTCSIVVYFFNSNVAHFVNIGDSRIYAIGNTYKKALTKDDKLFYNSNAITKCFGMPLKKDDLQQNVLNMRHESILLCSDGFYKLLEKDINIFEAIIDEKTSENRINRLIRGKNSDDATYILLKNRS